MPAQNFKVKIKTFISFKGKFPKDEFLKKTYAFSIFLYVKTSKKYFLNSSDDRDAIFS